MAKGLKVKASEGNTKKGSDLVIKAKPVDPKEYETKLSPEEESKFQEWLEEKYEEGHITKGDYDHYKEHGYGYNYDFRAAFKDKDSGGINSEDNEWHWSDVGKKPNHPTFSNESIHYNDKTARLGGKWDGEKYTKNPKVGPPVPPKESK